MSKRTLSFLLLLVGGASVSSADVLIQSQAFPYSGTTSSFTVPASSTYVIVKAWAGGGAGGRGTTGGAGGFSQASFNVNPGDRLNIIVGGGGSNPYANYRTDGGWPDGGNGSPPYASGGGARSEVVVFNVSTNNITGVVIAGGGGGGGDYTNGGNGGVGGGLSGGAPQSGGGEGTQSVGGAGGYSEFGIPGGAGGGVTFTDITTRVGGSNTCDQGYTGAGGGGGYFGGGAGGSNFSSPYGTSGGGGSGYAMGATSANLIQASAQTPPSNTDPDYIAGVGTGGNPTTLGGTGLVVVYAYQGFYAPVFPSNPDQSVAMRQPINYTPAVSANPAVSSMSASGLPPGLSMDGSGLIMGRPSAAGTYTATYTASNAAGTRTGTQIWSVAAPVLTLSTYLSATYANAGDTIAIQTTSTANFGVAWTENKMWAPNSPSIDLDNQYPPTYNPPSFNAPQYTYFIPSQTGTYTLQVRVADQYYNYQDYFYPIIVGTVAQTAPYSTGFDSYALGNLFPQDNWLVWQGRANVANESAQAGANSLRLDVFSQLTRVMKAFTSPATDLFVDFWARPAASPIGSPVDNSGIIDFGVERLGFQVTSAGQATIYAYNGNGSGSGAWVSTGKTFSVDANGLATGWVHLTSEPNYTTKKWKLWINGSPAPATYNFLSNTTTALSSVTFWGTSFSSWYLDTFSVATTSPLVFTAAASWPATPVSGLTDGAFNITWNAAVSPSSPITNYQVTLKKAGTTVTTKNVTVTNTAFTGLLPSTAYTVTVVSTNAGGQTATSAAYTVTTLADQTPPTVPGSLRLNGAVSGTSVPLIWNASTDLVGVAGYRVYRGTTLIITQTATSFTDTGLTAGNTYVYKVYAFDAVGNTSAAASLTASTGYLLTVTSGTSASSNLITGATTTITANAPATGYLFQNWIVVSGAGTFANANNSATTFTMGTGNTVIQATYKLNPVGDADGDGILNGVEQALGLDPLKSNAIDNTNGTVKIKVHTPR